MYRKLNRNASRVPNTLLDALSKHQVVPIAGSQVAAGLCDSDDRSIGLQFSNGKTEVRVSLQIQGAHIRMRGVIEPTARAQSGRPLRTVAVPVIRPFR